MYNDDKIYDAEIVDDDAPKQITLYSDNSRIGNADREAAQAHILKMRHSGHLSGEEAGVRANHIASAQTSAQLRQATSDLPKPKPPFIAAWKHLDWDSPKVFVPVLTLGTMASVGFAATPFILASLLGFYHNPDLMNAIAIPGVIIAVIGFVASLVSMLVKLDK